MAARSWRWLRCRVLALLDVPTGQDATGHPIFATRLQSALYQPPAEMRQSR
jgi:hypothetical protein